MKAKHFFFVLALHLFGQCFAGYSVKITQGNGLSCMTGAVSGCYLTAGMAMTNVCNYTTSIVAVDPDAKTFTANSYYGQSSGIYGDCTATPIVTTQAVFGPGLYDPSIGSDGSVSGVSSGGSSGSGASSELVTTLQTTVTALQGQLAAVTTANIQNAASISQVNAVLNEPFDLATALAATAFFFSTVIFFYGVSKSIGAVLTAIKRPLGRG